LLNAIYEKIYIQVMFRRECNYVGKLRRPPIEGLILNFTKNGEGANENLPFFICFNTGETK